MYWKLLDFITEIRPRTGYCAARSTCPSRSASVGGADPGGQVDPISTRQMAASDARMNETFGRLRQRLTMIVALAVSVGLLLAGFTIRRTLRLERNCNSAMGRCETQQELKELSARLVSAQEEERRTISRELHDEVGQSLSALLMEAGNAPPRFRRTSPEVRRHVESIKKLAEASVNVIRNMTLLLRPSMLDDFGLVPALNGRRARSPSAPALRVHVAAENAPASCPMNSRPASIAWCRRRCTTAPAMPARAASGSVVRRKPSHPAVAWKTTATASTRGACAAWAWWAWRSGSRHLGGAFAFESRPGHGTRVAVELPLAAGR